MIAEGDSKLAAKVLAKAINDGDGEALAVVLKESFAEGDELGRVATEGNSFTSHTRANSIHKQL